MNANLFIIVHGPADFGTMFQIDLRTFHLTSYWGTMRAAALIPDNDDLPAPFQFHGISTNVIMNGTYNTRVGGSSYRLIYCVGIPPVRADTFWRERTVAYPAVRPFEIPDSLRELYETNDAIIDFHFVGDFHADYQHIVHQLEQTIGIVWSRSAKFSLWEEALRLALMYKRNWRPHLGIDQVMNY